MPRFAVSSRPAATSCHPARQTTADDLLRRGRLTVYRSLLADHARAAGVTSRVVVSYGRPIRSRPGDPGPRHFRVSFNTAPSLRPAVQAGSKIGNRRGNSGPWCPPPWNFVLTWRENLQRPAVSSPPVAIPNVIAMGRPRHDGCAILRAPASTFVASDLANGAETRRAGRARTSGAAGRLGIFSFSPYD